MTRQEKDWSIDHGRIGSRWEETFDRLETLHSEHQHELTDNELDFITKQMEAIANFKGKAFFSAAQLNYLTGIERKYERKW